MPAYLPTLWSPTDTLPALSQEEIHLWDINLATTPEVTNLLSTSLSSKELEYAHRRPEKLRSRYIASKGYLRHLLGKYLGIPPGEIRYIFGELGKPALSPEFKSGLSFNLSDCGNKGLLAVAYGREIGVDLEQLPRNVNERAIAQKLFSPSEANALNAAEAEKLNESFLACWTRKEAWGKAIGRGIHYPMKNTPLCNQLSEPELQYCFANDNWLLRQFRPDSHSVACLVGSGVDWKMSCFRWTLMTATGAQ
ncbi:MAG: hypothetical protein CL393_04955 [Acidiferrobacteraceae bacterium]|jgi:4'-phosphopantetheinyl transferase|nr:hypothetical protein [Acidiferrobacteraceae bacterium]|tara:strand:- start:777 stop:1529 length:753 start_codon:yes stop_codon:yes gene_type:complete